MQHYKPAIARELFKALTVTPFQYSKPSPVQSAVFDLLPGLANPLEAKDEEAPRDLLVKAKTGTGKTIAFLLPALQARIRDLERQRAEHSDPPKDVRNALRYREKATSGALILSPTRELATQIANEASRMASHINGAKVQLFVGGASKVMQMKSWQHLRRDIIVATPGRMIDMIQSSSDIRDVLSKTRTLILDEADTLLDMGFKDDIERIMEHLPPKDERQTFLFSATVPSEIRQIARKALKPNHLFIDTVPPEEANVHLNIPQYATVLDNAKDQVPHILRLLAHDMLLHPDGGKAIVFLPTTRLTELFAQVIDSMKKYLPWGARRTIIYELHSKKSQASRDAAADRFRKASGGYHILVTSDVSARGVDYPNVTRVIQIGVPSSRDIYIHRVGRTGRAGKAGRGDIVLLDWEAGFLRSLKDLPIQKIGVQELTQEVEAMATEQDEAPQKPIAKDLHKQPNLKATTREIFSLRRSSTPGMVVSGPMQSDIHNRLTEIEAGVQEELFSSLDSYIVKEAFGSLLGYYMPRGADINARKMEMVDGLKGWAQQSMGLAEEPYVSEAMLKKMGASRERKSFDKRRDSFDRKPRGGFSSVRLRFSMYLGFLRRGLNFVLFCRDARGIPRPGWAVVGKARAIRAEEATDSPSVKAGAMAIKTGPFLAANAREMTMIDLPETTGLTGIAMQGERNGRQVELHDWSHTMTKRTAGLWARHS